MIFSKQSCRVLFMLVFISLASLVQADTAPPLPAKATQEAQTELAPLGGVRASGR